MSRWLVWVSFDGTAFSGFQRQETCRTVAGELEAAWMRWHGERIDVFSSSRTDAGVHARRMPVTLTTTLQLPAKAFVLGWSRHLPDDVAVIEAVAVDDTFHVRHDAIAKRYIYRLWCARPRSPLHRLDHWHARRPLDLDAMRSAAAMLEGDHDFAAFRTSSCTALSTVRSMRQVKIVEAAPAVHIIVEGNAFLHNMVRIMVGTLVEVGRGKRAPEAVRRALLSGRRVDAGQTAPPNGLTLDDVVYGPYGARQGTEHKQLLARMHESLGASRADAHDES